VRVGALELCAEPECECIRTLRTIEGDGGDPVFDRKQDVLGCALFHHDVIMALTRDYAAWLSR
jgi:hypothetical protein